MKELYLTSSLDSFFQLVVAIIAFILVLVLTYLTTRFIGNYQKNANKGTNFENIETYRLSNTKYLQLLRVGEKYVVIAVCKDTISAVLELDKDDIQIPEYSQNTPTSFKEMLEKMKANGAFGKKELEDEHKEE